MENRSHETLVHICRMEDMSKIDPIIFQPFGAGPRACIAMRFAIMEVKMAICKILLSFRLDVANDTPVRRFYFCRHLFDCFCAREKVGNKSKF